MIQRFLGKVLSAGLAEIQADLTLLDDVFEQYGLSATELTAIREWFQAHPPSVKFQFARTDDVFPLYAIVLGGEEESGLFIGNDGTAARFDGEGLIGPDDPDFGLDIKSSVWSHTYQVLCCSSGHPDGALYLYEVAKAIFVSANLSECGLHSTKFSGMDLSHATEYLPENIFIRVFQIKGEREFERLDRGSRVGKAFRIEGLHIDKTGSPSDVGGVQTLVTVTTEDDDE